MRKSLKTETKIIMELFPMAKLLKGAVEIPKEMEVPAALVEMPAMLTILKRFVTNSKRIAALSKQKKSTMMTTFMMILRFLMSILSEFHQRTPG